jgi:hypothetical protein
VKTAELVAVPVELVTEIFPVVAPLGTVAVIFVDETTVNEAETPANFTLVAPVKFLPLIVTNVPTGPLVGENDEIVGLAVVVTVNEVSLVSVPPGVVTAILPVEAPDGTVAVILVDELTVNEAETPANLTDVVVKPVPLKFDPVIVTDVPTGPLVGENDETTGAGTVVVITVKSDELVAVPSGVVTLMRPVVAPEGTWEVIFPHPFTVKVAWVPLNLTAVASLSAVPWIVTVVPTLPLAGENVEIVGAAAHDAGAIVISSAITATTSPALMNVPERGRDISCLLPMGGQLQGGRSCHIAHKMDRGFVSPAGVAASRRSMSRPGRHLAGSSRRW